MTTSISISATDARRLSITRQRLAGPRPAPTAEGLLEVARDLGCIQLDPISAVARTNHLVPWSRLGAYDTALFDQLLWKDRSLFEYFAHAASLVLTEDYPIHHATMMRYRTGGRTWFSYAHEWMSKNQQLLDSVLGALRERGPLSSKDFEEKATVSWWSSGWTNDRNINRMLDFLWVQGIVMVAGRKGQLRLWDLAERVLPDWTPREELPLREVVRRSAEKSLRSLGVGRERDIKWNYVRHRYWELPSVLKELEAEGRIVRVQIEGEGDPKRWRGPWYIQMDDLPLLERIEAGEWEGRTTLLSPFDNLIADRARTSLLFDFDYRIEIYTPKEKRQYGYYVLPILHGDRLIGRIDPCGPQGEVPKINAVYAEPGAPMGGEAGKAVAEAIEELASWLGAREIAYGERVPDGWRKALR